MASKQKTALKNELQAVFWLWPMSLPTLYDVKGDFVSNTDVRYDTLEQIFQTSIDCG